MVFYYSCVILIQNNSSMNCCKCLLENVAECSLDSFLLTGIAEQSILEQLGFRAGETTLDEKAEILFLGQLYRSKFLSLCKNFICTIVFSLICEYAACSEYLVSG